MGDRCVYQFVERVYGCLPYCGQDARRGHGAAGYRRWREMTIAERWPNPFNRNTCHIGDDLGHGCVGPAPHILCCTDYLCGAILENADLCCAGAAHAGIRGRGHAPADQIFAVTHRAWPGIARGPAEFLSSDVVTFLQVLTRPGLVG